MDKRDLSLRFRERLALLVNRSGLSQAAFARAAGIDRSALSQLLAETAVRLPRTESLLGMARAGGVSLDWLLGQSEDEGTTGEIRRSFEIEENPGGFDRTLLARWHAEAVGTKIRYVPSGIPDLLRTEAVIAREAAATSRDAASQRDETQYRIDYNRRPETDMEVCMPMQTLDLLARGQGVWTGMASRVRREQLLHMAKLLDDLYPTFRLFLFDARMTYTAAYTIFGSIRAAVYIGDLYLVLNRREAISTLTRHFDTLIRNATVNAHEAAAHVGSLAKTAD
jgi:transcriptional regulator with XRE-family HTH domain